MRNVARVALASGHRPPDTASCPSAMTHNPLHLSNITLTNVR